MPARTSHPSNRSLRALRFSWLSLVAVAAIAPVLAGCELPIAMMIADDISNDDDASYGGGYYDDGYYGDSASALETKNAVLQGDLGSAVGFNGAANFVDAYDDGYYATITLWADGTESASGQWAAMSALSIEGEGLSADVFKPGANLHFNSEDYGSTPYVSVYSCSGTGSDAGMLDYESSGTTTDIVVTESEEPGMVHLSITSTHTGYGTQLVRSELDVVVPE